MPELLSLMMIYLFSCFRHVSKSIYDILFLNSESIYEVHNFHLKMYDPENSLFLAYSILEICVCFFSKSVVRCFSAAFSAHNYITYLHILIYCFNLIICAVEMDGSLLFFYIYYYSYFHASASSPF